MFLDITLNSFSSLLEVFIAFNAAFIIGNHFEESIYKYFYIKGKELDELIDELTNQFNRADEFLDSIEDIHSQSKKVEYKASLFKERETYDKLVLKAKADYSSNNPVFSIICFTNVFYCIYLLIMSSIESNHKAFIINWTIFVSLFSLLYFLEITFLNKIFSKNWRENPVSSVKTLFIIIISGIIYSVICKYYFVNFNALLPNIGVDYKTLIYLFIVLYPTLHFILFFNNIRTKISAHENDINKEVKEFYGRLNKDIENEELGLLVKIKSWRITFAQDQLNFTSNG